MRGNPGKRQCKEVRKEKVLGRRVVNKPGWAKTDFRFRN